MSTQVAQTQKSAYKGILILEAPKLAETRSDEGAMLVSPNPANFRTAFRVALSAVVLALGLFLLTHDWYQQKQLRVQLQETRKLLHVTQLAKSTNDLPKVEPLSIPFSQADAGRWWSFDHLQPNFGNEPKSEDYLGEHSMELKGQVRSWYGGGVGTYLGADASAYTHLSLNIFGYGPDSGVIKVELVDDDNRNYQAEYRSAAASMNKDDVWTYALKVDWQGWRHINIPLAAFEDANPSEGDDVWNPSQWLGSGGLLQMQWIAGASVERAPFHIKMNQPRLIQIRIASNEKNK